MKNKRNQVKSETIKQRNCNYTNRICFIIPNSAELSIKASQSLVSAKIYLFNVLLIKGP